MESGNMERRWVVDLKVKLIKPMPSEVFARGITHQLATMARDCGLYQVLWEPGRLFRVDGAGVVKAGELIHQLVNGLKLLKSSREIYVQFERGGGTYEELVFFVEAYLAACYQHPDATVELTR